MDTGRTWGQRQDSYQSSWSNKDIVNDHDRIMREQDEALDTLYNTVTGTREIAIDMSIETEEQIHLLDRIDGKTTANSSRIKNATTQAETVAIKSSTKILWLIIVLLFISMIILMIFALKK